MPVTLKNSAKSPLRDANENRFDSPEKLKAAIAATTVTLVAMDSLRLNPKNTKRHSQKQVELIAKNYLAFGVHTPIVIDETGMILCGEGRYRAARLVYLDRLPAIVLPDLTDHQKQALAISDNRMAELGEYDLELISQTIAELYELDLDFDPSILGYDTVEIDSNLCAAPSKSRQDPTDEFDLPDTLQAVTKAGDVWLLGRHRLACGDALSNDTYNALMGDDRAQIVVADPPYNVPNKGHVTGRVGVREFAEAHGELTSEQFTEFLGAACAKIGRYVLDGAVIFVCMDWRHLAGKSEKILRCAIYTRKSTEHGLELEFNSLDAQREACEAYIKSQASEGWQALPERYDDPAYSGGNLERPGVQKLLKDIEAGKVDVVVVYKIDRLTRSLADFAKLVEVFDAKAVSFVAITQQFNTTTSMGRLTLNVLLSFAQFERELASERVRDKIAASRKKGKWTGGSVPLGYDTKDKRLTVNPAEAKTVGLIFERYLALKSFQKVIDDLNAQGIVSKRRPIKDRMAGGVPFTYGPLAYLLKNRTYLGETGHGGKWFAGDHEPIVDRTTFDAVQELLSRNSEGRAGRRQQTGALLTGLIYDDRGNRMSPSYSVKNRVRYPFYVSSSLLKGRKAQAGSVGRISASSIEQAILRSVGNKVGADPSFGGHTPREFAERTIDRIVVQPDRLTVALRPDLSRDPLEIPWSAANRSDESRIEGDDADSGKPDQALVQAVARAHVWIDLLMAGAYDSVEDLATAAGVHPKVIRNRVRLAFLSPDLNRAILSGEQPKNAGLAELNGPISLSWHRHGNTLYGSR